MLESGIDPATVRFEVGRPAYCKYSIFLLENRSSHLTVPIETVKYDDRFSNKKYTIFTVAFVSNFNADFETHGSRIDPRFRHF